MCLCSKAKKSQRKILFKRDCIGYKIFNFEKKNLIFPYFAYKDQKKIKTGKWVHRDHYHTHYSPKVLEFSEAETRYESGFHIYKNLKDAQTALRDTGDVIRKVMYDEVTCYGFQRVNHIPVPVIVARKMFIIPKWSGYKKYR